MTCVFVNGNSVCIVSFLFVKWSHNYIIAQIESKKYYFVIFFVNFLLYYILSGGIYEIYRKRFNLR